MAAEAANPTTEYLFDILKVLIEIRDNIFSLNKKFEIFASLKDPDFVEQLIKQGFIREVEEKGKEINKNGSQPN